MSKNYPLPIPKLDFTTYKFIEDFTSVTTASSIGAATSLEADNKWGITQIGNGAAGKYQSAPADGVHLGVIMLTTAAGASGNGVVLFLGGGALSTGYFSPTNTAFDYVTAFQMSSNTNIGVYIGFSSNASQPTVPTSSATQFLGLRYDTSLGDTMFTAVAQNNNSQSIQTLTAADNNWHVLRISSLTPGVININIDGGEAASFNINVPGGLLDYGVHQVVSRSAVNPSLNVDYVGMQVTNLAR
jgi:hypothetical protein